MPGFSPPDHTSSVYLPASRSARTFGACSREEPVEKVTLMLYLSSNSPITSPMPVPSPQQKKACSSPSSCAAASSASFSASMAAMASGAGSIASGIAVGSIASGIAVGSIASGIAVGSIIAVGVGADVGVGRGVAVGSLPHAASIRAPAIPTITSTVGLVHFISILPASYRRTRVCRACVPVSTASLSATAGPTPAIGSRFGPCTPGSTC